MRYGSLVFAMWIVMLFVAVVESGSFIGLVLALGFIGLCVFINKKF